MELLFCKRDYSVLAEIKLCLRCAYSGICAFIGSSVVIAGKVPTIGTAQ